MISSVAMADHIGVYADNSGSSCSLAAGFQSGSTAAVIEKFSLGTTGSRFKVTLPAGSSFFSFSSPYTPVGSMTSDLSMAYGQCLTGDVVIGNIIAILNPGSGAVVAADLQPFILYTTCVFAELPATGGTYYVGGTGNCNEIATEPTTWGQVKALYR
jgi:hypothetical protein